MLVNGSDSITPKLFSKKLTLCSPFESNGHMRGSLITDRILTWGLNLHHGYRRHDLLFEGHHFFLCGH